MAEQQIQSEQEQDEDRGPEQMLESHHRQTLWIPWTLILPGVWLLVAPWSFGYLNEDLGSSRAAAAAPGSPRPRRTTRCAPS